MKLIISGIPVKVVKKRMKNAYLRVKPDGRVVLSAPVGMADADIQAFAQAHAAWLQKTHDEVQRRPQVSAATVQTGETVYLWGTPCILVVHERPGAASAIRKDGTRLFLTLRPGLDGAHRAAVLRELLRDELSRAIAARLPQIEALTGLCAKEWRTKDMKTRWGTCNVRARRIWINLQLVHHPLICLDYILLHELLHLVEVHHNAHFYALMTSYLPQWKEIRAMLNR